MRSVVRRRRGSRPPLNTPSILPCSVSRRRSRSRASGVRGERAGSGALPAVLPLWACGGKSKFLKAITASSPLQYRKGLQLLEARRLLRAGTLSVSEAAFDVGYESAAQFSRDCCTRSRRLCAGR
ncbi:helix-turn-helix domain-containing protein [Pyxidicoccus sp. 3LG]